MPSHLRKKTRYRVAAFKPATRVSIALAALMMSLGIFAVIIPSAAGIRPAILFGWLALLSGLTYVSYALAADNAATFVYSALVGAAYALGGVYLAVNPTLEWGPLTLVLSANFLAQGILEFVFFFEFRPRSTWILFNSLTAVILGSMIWRSWPADSTSAIGLIVGVNLIVSGFSRLMHSTFARRSLRLVASSE